MKSIFRKNNRKKVGCRPYGFKTYSKRITEVSDIVCLKDLAEYNSCSEGAKETPAARVG